MNKYLRTSQHVPIEKTQSTQSQYNDFISELHEAGEILKALRENRGWSEEELGNKISLDREHVALMERGEKSISAETAQKLGKLFKVDHHLFL